MAHRIAFLRPLLLARPYRTRASSTPSPPFLRPTPRPSLATSPLFRRQTRAAPLATAAAPHPPGSMDPEAAHARLAAPDPPVYLDVRTPAEFADGHVPAAVNVPVLLDGKVVPTFVDDVAAALPGPPALIVGCKSGRRSMIAIELLGQAGWTDLTNLDGGFDAWAANGSLPIEK